jgi:hypothetical protein
LLRTVLEELERDQQLFPPETSALTLQSVAHATECQERPERCPG